MKRLLLSAVTFVSFASVARAELKPANAVVDTWCTGFTPGQPLGAPQYCVALTAGGTSRYLTITNRTASPGYRTPTFVRLNQNLPPNGNPGVNPLVRDFVGFSVETGRYALEQRFDVRLFGLPAPVSLSVWKNGRLILNNVRLEPVMTTMGL